MTANRLLPAAVAALAFAGAAHTQQWQLKSGSSSRAGVRGGLRSPFSFGRIRGAPVLITAIFLNRWCGVAF